MLFGQELLIFISFVDKILIFSIFCIDMNRGFYTMKNLYNIILGLSGHKKSQNCIKPSPWHNSLAYGSGIIPGFRFYTTFRLFIPSTPSIIFYIIEAKNFFISEKYIYPRLISRYISKKCLF